MKPNAEQQPFKKTKVASLETQWDSAFVFSTLNNKVGGIDVCWIWIFGSWNSLEVETAWNTVEDELAIAIARTSINIQEHEDQ